MGFFVYVSKPFYYVSKSFFFVTKTFLNENKLFLNVSKTLLIYENFFIKDFLFATAVAVSGHRFTDIELYFTLR